MKRFLASLLFLLVASPGWAAICGSVPYTFSPGTTIFSSQVNSNFSAITSCVNAGAAASGANADITALQGTGAGVAVTGTNSNTSGAAGTIGQYISSNVASGGAVSMSSGAAADITSVSLTAGDWQCAGNAVFNSNSNTLTAAQGWISSTSASLPTLPNGGAYAQWTGSTSTLSPAISVGEIRISIASTTSIYLSAQPTSGGATLVYGFIGCRRAR